MAGAVLEHHRVVRRGGVEQGPVGVALFPQRVVVVALGDDPRTRLRTLGADVLPQPAGDFLQVGAFIQRHLEQGVGRGGKVTVRVDEGGQQGVPLQIHPPRPGPGQLAGFLPRPRQDDPAVPHQQGLSCARAVLQGQHRAVFKQGVHTHPPVCLRVSVSVCPITRIAPAGRLCQLLEVPGGLQAAKHPGR